MPIVLTHNTSIKLHGAVADDTISTDSSTIPVYNSPHQLKKKKVRFSTAPEQLCRYYENHTICREDNKIYCWYRQTSLDRFRRHTLQCVQAASPVSSPTYHRVLEGTLEACEKEAQEGGENNTTTAAAALAVPYHESLQDCVKVVSDHVGLEKWASAKVANAKKARRQELNQLILRAKEESSRANPQEQDDDSDCDCDDRQHDAAERLRHECERITRPHRLVARCLAGALTTAVRNGMEDDDDEEDDSSFYY